MYIILTKLLGEVKIGFKQIYINVNLWYTTKQREGLCSIITSFA